MNVSTQKPNSNTKRKMNPLAWILILSASFFAIFLIVSGVLFLSKSPGKGSGKSAALFGGGSIGVVEVNGVIMDSKKTVAALDDFAEDPEIRGVVLRINSPGGSVAPSQEIYESVKNFKKPLVASMGSVAASGGFYISCGAKKVYANPGTITGSIGVIMEFVNLGKLYEWAKIQRYAIKTGKYKGAGAEYRELTSEERELLQGMLDNVLVQFKTAVSTGRKLPMPSVDAIADGRVLSGAQAKTAKLVDELGTFQDAVNDVAAMANIKGKPKLVYPRSKRNRILQMLLDNNSDEEESRSDVPTSRLSAFLRGVLGISIPLPEERLTLPAGVYWLWNGAR